MLHQAATGLLTMEMQSPSIPSLWANRSPRKIVSEVLGCRPFLVIGQEFAVYICIDASERLGGPKLIRSILRCPPYHGKLHQTSLSLFTCRRFASLGQSNPL